MHTDFDTRTKLLVYENIAESGRIPTRLELAASAQ